MSKYKCEDYGDRPKHYCPACYHGLKAQRDKLLEFVKNEAMLDSVNDYEANNYEQFGFARRCRETLKEIGEI